MRREALHVRAADGGLQKYPLLGKTLFAPGAWVMLARGQALNAFPSVGVSPEKAVADRAFPVLTCDAVDTTLTCRRAETIYAAAAGPKFLWVVPEAYHATSVACGLLCRPDRDVLSD